MKLSVSVPDELWDRSRAKRPDLSTSHLVQEALERFAADVETAGFSLARPDGVEERFSHAREQLAAFAREEFEKGYGAAVELVSTLSWWDIQSLAVDHRFDIRAWVGGYCTTFIEAAMHNIPDDWAPSSETMSALTKAFGNLVSPHGDDGWGPSVPYLRGASQALRELWNEVNTGDAGVRASDEEAAVGS